MIVAIASSLVESLVDEAARALPNEACGMLLGHAGAIEKLVPSRNVAAHPERSFEIDPALLLRTHREARAKGLQLVGHYHSHPNGRAQPSLRDAAAAVENGALWLVIAGGRVTGWQVAPAPGALHGRFSPVTLQAA